MTHGDPTRGGRHGDEGLKIGREGLQPVIDFIDKAQADGKPFFVWYAPMMPHSRTTRPERLLAKYQGKHDVPVRGEVLGHVRVVRRDVRRAARPPRQKGLAENTLVIYLHDNGWIQDPNAGKFAPKSKQSPYDGGVRTPILVRWPGKVTPRTSDDLAHSIDLTPTILAACGVETAGRPARRRPARRQGR